MPDGSFDYRKLLTRNEYLYLNEVFEKEEMKRICYYVENEMIEEFNIVI